MHPLIKRAAMTLPPIARLAADRDALLAQCRAVGVERDAARAEIRRLVTQDAFPFRPIRPSAYSLPASLPPGDVAAALGANQICLLRDALAPDWTAALRQRAETAVAGELGGSYPQIFGSRGTNSRLDMSVLLGVLASPCLAAVRALARQRHGTADLVVPFHGLMVRRMDPAHSAIDTAVIPYHQDAFGLPPEFRFVNCWTLLSPDECGETAPGLEFIPDAVDCFLGQEANPASPHYGFLEAPHAALARYAAAYDPWRPVVRLGDVLMFTDVALHRTWLSPAHTRARISAEIRIVARTDAVRDYISRHGMVTYIITGETLSGPAIVSYHGAGNPIVIEQGSWRIG